MNPLTRRPTLWPWCLQLLEVHDSKSRSYTSHRDSVTTHLLFQDIHSKAMMELFVSCSWRLASKYHLQMYRSMWRSHNILLHQAPNGNIRRVLMLVSFRCPSLRFGSHFTTTSISLLKRGIGMHFISSATYPFLCELEFNVHTAGKKYQDAHL